MISQTEKPGMRMAIGDADGNLLGITNVVGSQWTISDNFMINTSEVSVTTIRAGIAVLFSFVDDQDNILDNGGTLDNYRLGFGDTLIFRPGKLTISWTIAAKGLKKLPRMNFV